MSLLTKSPFHGFVITKHANALNLKPLVKNQNLHFVEYFTDYSQ